MSSALLEDALWASRLTAFGCNPFILRGARGNSYQHNSFSRDGNLLKVRRYSFHAAYSILRISRRRE